ncbi:MAG: hypothetical protein KDC48_08545 [Planctomycetes bacterium]|nr:hypothetical protein [Planctomycetota bacterium]
MRELDIWGDLEASALKLAFSAIERELGCPMDDLDRVWMVVEMSDNSDSQREERGIRVLEGNKPLPLPPSAANGWERDEIGGYKVLRRDVYRNERMYQPTPNVQIWGTANVMDAVFAGKPCSGTPSPDVMSLLAGKEQALAWYVMSLDHPAGKRLLVGPFEGTQWAEEDAPQFLCMRLLATGESDDPHLTVEVVLRHATPAGVPVTSKAVDDLLERLATQKEMLILRPLLGKFVKKEDGVDVRLRADFGRSRQAVGHVATLAVTLLLPRHLGGNAPPVQVDVAEEVEEPPPPPPVEPPKKKD